MANFLKSLFVKGVEIDTAGASSGNVLSYNGTKFAPAAPGSGSLALDDLSDVVITSPYAYQTLSYDGTNWINSDSSVITYVRNAEATTLNVGEVVYLYQQQGDRASVKRAINTGDSTSAKTLGVVAASIASSSDGPVVTQGYVTGCNLGSFTAGQTVYLSSTAGQITATKPYAPNHLVYIGVVVRANNGNGILYVRAQNGYELDEIHDVDLTTTPPTSGQYLRYNGTLWTADTIDLGTDTNGSYVASLVAGTGISLANNSGEGATPTITNSGVTSINTTLTGNVTGVVTTSDTGTVTSAMIADGTIVNGDINASAGIALSKLASGTSGQVVVANGSGVPTYTTISGDITISSTGVATIAADSVALGTDTTGNYMSGVSAGTGISVSHTPSEGSTATVSVDTTYSGFAPVGSMLPWAGGANTTATYTNSDVPAGWLLCDGQAVSRTTYSSLFAVIGVRYGQGDGSTTFNLPNLIGQLAIGSKTANAATNNTRVTSVSIATANSTANHTHSMNASNITNANAVADHTHNMNASNITNANATVDHAHNMNASTVNIPNGGGHIHYTTGNATIPQHDHSYYKPNSGVNGYNTGLSSANYTIGWNSLNAQGGNVYAISANHDHTPSVSIGTPVTTSGNTTLHTHNNTIAVGTPVTTSGNTTLHSHTNTISIGTPVTTSGNDTAHSHTTGGQNVVWIIRF